jgi:hypothetical protein
MQSCTAIPRSAAVLAEAARLQTRLDKLTAAAVADMQHCHPNATSGVSILHSVAEPRHRVGEAEAMAPTCVRFHYGHREIAPELTGHGLPLSKCEAYNRVYEQSYGSR